MTLRTHEQQRLDDIHALPCMCCESAGASQPSRTEAHHLVDKGYRKHSGGHMATIPLCGSHHRGICLSGHTTMEMVARFGPSLAVSKRSFVEKYGTDRDLLEVGVRDRVPAGPGQQ